MSKKNCCSGILLTASNVNLRFKEQMSKPKIELYETYLYLNGSVENKIED